MHKPFAAALFSIARERGTGEEYGAAMDLAARLLEENAGYAQLLDSPALPRMERLSALESAFSHALPEPVLSLMQLLCIRGCLRRMPDCAVEYKRLLDSAGAVSPAKVASAVPLTVEEQGKLKARLEAVSDGPVALECIVDEALLGGVRVEMNGWIMDGSLRRRLRDLREAMRG